MDSVNGSMMTPAPLVAAPNPSWLHGSPVAAQVHRAGSTERMFPGNSSGFQLPRNGVSAEENALHNAAEVANSRVLTLVQEYMQPEQPGVAAPSGLRLIESAQEEAMTKLFQYADNPGQAKAVYRGGTPAARIGVEDLAVALEVLAEHGGDPRECTRMAKNLCAMLVNDRLDENSGFSAWRPGNCYGKVKELSDMINRKLDGLESNPDIFKTVIERTVMPATRRYLEAKFGNLSYATWQKIDAAGGLISTAAAEAAGRMNQSLLSVVQGVPTIALRAKVNQWRVALHCAELMRPTSMPREREDQTVSTSPAAPVAAPRPSSSTAARVGVAEGPAPTSMMDRGNTTRTGDVNMGDLNFHFNDEMFRSAFQRFYGRSGEGLGMSFRDNAEDRTRQDRSADQSGDLDGRNTSHRPESAVDRRQHSMFPSGGAGTRQHDTADGVGNQRLDNGDWGLDGPEPGAAVVECLESMDNSLAALGRGSNGRAHHEVSDPATVRGGKDIPREQSEAMLSAGGREDMNSDGASVLSAVDKNQAGTTTSPTVASLRPLLENTPMQRQLSAKLAQQAVALHQSRLSKRLDTLDLASTSAGQGAGSSQSGGAVAPSGKTELARRASGVNSYYLNLAGYNGGADSSDSTRSGRLGSVSPSGSEAGSAPSGSRSPSPSGPEGHSSPASGSTRYRHLSTTSRPDRVGPGSYS